MGVGNGGFCVSFNRIKSRGSQNNIRLVVTIGRRRRKQDEQTDWILCQVFNEQTPVHIFFFSFLMKSL